jgi:4-methyl-5(b-hydroxyethyl)-thiazole monophosphate biosynthesis
MNKRVLCLLVAGFEEVEAIAPIDVLRRAGAEVVVASVTGGPLVTGRCGLAVQTDAALDAVADQPFDLLLLPGGPGVKTLRGDGRAARLAQTFTEQGKRVGAICAAPTILSDANLLSGKRFTAHFSVHDELPGVLAQERVVKDGNLITSRGAGTALEFGLALVRELFGEAKEREVATAIMA